MTTYGDVGMRSLSDVKDLMARRFTEAWIHQPHQVGGVKLHIGGFANVVKVANGLGVAITTDGVGTKTMVARAAGRYDTIGIDCVAANVNDLLCVGAAPLAMVDHLSIDHTIDDRMIGEIVEGLVAGAELAEVSIVGGETAQVSDLVTGFDLSGTAIGVVDLDGIYGGRHVEVGDAIVGIYSSGVHCNGLTLARKVLADPATGDYHPSVLDELLIPTRIYVRPVLDALGQVDVRAMVHVTGGGLLNLLRVGGNQKLTFRLDSLPAPPKIFNDIASYGNIPLEEMYSTFNMGVGFCMIVASADADRTVELVQGSGYGAQTIGEVFISDRKSIEIPPLNLCSFRHGFVEI